MQFVLDASISLRWCLTGQQTGASSAVLRLMNTAEVYVPMIWPYEMASVVLREVNKTNITSLAAADFFLTLRRFNIVVGNKPVDISSLYEAGKSHRLTGYDAAYVELALELGLPLATADKAMIAAAQRAGVPLLA